MSHDVRWLARAPNTEKYAAGDYVAEAGDVRSTLVGTGYSAVVIGAR